MQPIKHPASNFTYTAPKGTEDSCSDLAVIIGSDQFGRTTQSHWLPSAEDREIIANGGAVTLKIHGAQQPIVSIGAEYVPVTDDQHGSTAAAAIRRTEMRPEKVSDLVAQAKADAAHPARLAYDSRFHKVRAEIGFQEYLDLWNAAESGSPMYDAHPYWPKVKADYDESKAGHLGGDLGAMGKM